MGSDLHPSVPGNIAYAHGVYHGVRSSFFGPRQHSLCPWGESIWITKADSRVWAERAAKAKRSHGAYVMGREGIRPPARRRDRFTGFGIINTRLLSRIPRSCRSILTLAVSSDSRRAIRGSIPSKEKPQRCEAGCPGAGGEGRKPGRWQPPQAPAYRPSHAHRRLLGAASGR